MRSTKLIIDTVKSRLLSIITWKFDLIVLLITSARITLIANFNLVKGEKVYAYAKSSSIEIKKRSTNLQKYKVIKLICRKIEAWGNGLNK